MKSSRILSCRLGRQSGISLVSIMVAITIGMILLAGMMQIFISNKQTYRVQEGMSRLQENGRFAMSFLTRTIRMTGYSGCHGLATQTNNIADLDGDGTADASSDFSNGGLLGVEYTSLPVTLTATDTLTASDVLPATDVIVISNGATQELPLTGNMVTDNANIQLGAAAAGLFKAHDILFISDCGASDIFAANNVSSSSAKVTIAHSSAVNTSSKLGKAYGTDAVVMAFEKAAYYIALNSSGEPSLFRRTLHGANMTTEELVDGVESMQIQYGEDLSGDGIANRYANADNISDMNNVVAVRISLLLRSSEEINVEPDTRSYTVLDATINPVDDRRSRRIFTTTIKLRNRGIL